MMHTLHDTGRLLRTGRYAIARDDLKNDAWKEQEVSLCYYNGGFYGFDNLTVMLRGNRPYDLPVDPVFHNTLAAQDLARLSGSDKRVRACVDAGRAVGHQLQRWGIRWTRAGETSPLYEDAPKRSQELEARIRSVDAVTHIFPARCDGELSLAARFMKPTLCIVPYPLTYSQVIELLQSLPVIPYTSPYLAMYFNVAPLKALLDFFLHFYHHLREVSDKDFNACLDRDIEQLTDDLLAFLSADKDEG